MGLCISLGKTPETVGQGRISQPVRNEMNPELMQTKCIGMCDAECWEDILEVKYLVMCISRPGRHVGVWHIKW